MSNCLLTCRRCVKSATYSHGISFCRIVSITFKTLQSSERYDEFIKLLTLVLKNVFLLAIPTAVVFFLLRFQIIKVIIGSTGSFGLENLKLTSAAFGILVPAIVTQSITTIIIRAFFAAKKTLVPFLISLTKFIFVITSSVLFLNLFKSNSDIKFFITNFFDVPSIQNNVSFYFPVKHPSRSVLSIPVLNEKSKINPFVFVFSKLSLPLVFFL